MNTISLATQVSRDLFPPEYKRKGDYVHVNGNYVIVRKILFREIFNCFLITSMLQDEVDDTSEKSRISKLKLSFLPTTILNGKLVRNSCEFRDIHWSLVL